MYVLLMDVLSRRHSWRRHGDTTVANMLVSLFLARTHEQQYHINLTTNPGNGSTTVASGATLTSPPLTSSRASSLWPCQSLIDTPSLRCKLRRGCAASCSVGRCCPGRVYCQRYRLLPFHFLCFLCSVSQSVGCLFWTGSSTPRTHISCLSSPRTSIILLVSSLCCLFFGPFFSFPIFLYSYSRSREILRPRPCAKCKQALVLAPGYSSVCRSFAKPCPPFLMVFPSSPHLSHETLS